MSLANKLVSPCRNRWDSGQEHFDLQNEGITFRERLVIAGFGNPKFFDDKGRYLICDIDGKPAIKMLQEADTIIKEMEK